MAAAIPDNILSALFPLPKFAHTPLAPQPLPGRTPASAEKLVALLRENHQKHHIYFNQSGFHK